MQLALSRRSDLGEQHADMSKESLEPISPPDNESDSDTERFIKSVEEVLADAANDRERRKKLRLEQGNRGGEKASRKLQTERQQTAGVPGGRRKPSNHLVRSSSKMGERLQQGERESPSRKKMKRFLLNEELREGRRNEKSNYHTQPASPRVEAKFQADTATSKVEERKGRKRPLERESLTRSHPDRRDSCSPMPKIPRLAHLNSNSRKFSYKGNRLTFAEILDKEGVVSGLQLHPLLKPLSELPVWVESETMSLREETAQEREDREKREARIARFGSTVQQVDEQEQQEWQDQEWQQLREV